MKEGGEGSARGEQRRGLGIVGVGGEGGCVGVGTKDGVWGGKGRMEE